TEVQNTFSSAFALDKAKLTRIVTILTERYQRAEATATPDFEVKLRNGKTIALSTLDEVFGLDNSIKNPITSLEVALRSERDAKTRLFSTVSFDDSAVENISVIVRSTDSKIAQELAAELEEQVERTLVSSWMTKLRAASLVPL